MRLLETINKQNPHICYYKRDIKTQESGRKEKKNKGKYMPG